MTSRPNLITAEDAALVLGISRATLRDWVRRGVLPRYGTERRALYDWRDLAAARNAPKPRRLRRVSLDDVA